MSLGAVKYIASTKENLRRTTINAWSIPYVKKARLRTNSWLTLASLLPHAYLVFSGNARDTEAITLSTRRIELLEYFVGVAANLATILICIGPGRRRHGV